MKTVRKFMPTDRYIYDFKLCTIGKVFAQFDTSQDARYYVTWASPKKIMIVCYAEGDVIIQTADNIQEFTDEILKIKAWNNENGLRFIGIDPGFNEELKNDFINAGLSDLLH